MKSCKVFFRSLLVIFCASILVMPEVARAKAVIDTLDFTMTGSELLDCDILGKINLVRDPSWSDEEYYFHLLDQYAVEISEGGYANVEEYRNTLDDDIKDAWDSLAKGIYVRYAQAYHDDYSGREEYYEQYHDELKDDYYRAYNLLALFGVDEYGDPIVNTPSIETYDVMANYCSSGNELISTTFSDDGYSGYLMLGGREVELEDKTVTTIYNGYNFHEDGFGDLKVELSRINATTIKAKYTVKNLTGADTNFGLAFYGDIELGENDYAAISKTDRSFMITQDRSENEGWFDFSKTFGAQFKIELDPVPTTTYIGEYYIAQNNRWNNSATTYYTAADDVDTGLAYSWKGQIGVNETKSFSATYTVDVADSFINNFYSYGNYTEPTSQIESVDGGALYMPEVSIAAQVGNHREWNTESDGTGIAYDADTTIIADKNRTNYYEVEVPNRVVAGVEKEYGYLRERSIVVTDSMREKYGPLADNVYSNVGIYIDVDEDDDEDLEWYIDEGIINAESVTNAAGKDYELQNLFEIDAIGYKWLAGVNDYRYEALEADDFPVTAKLKISDEYTMDRRNFTIVRLKYDEDSETYNEYLQIPTRYDEQTGELYFDVEEDYDIYKYAVVYMELPDVPNTGANTIEKTITVATTTVGLPIVLVAGYTIKRRAAKHSK